MVGWRILTSLDFESIFFVKYETASTIAGDDSSIPSVRRGSRKKKIDEVES